jgi:hypothetical protein
MTGSVGAMEVASEYSIGVGFEKSLVVDCVETMAPCSWKSTSGSGKVMAFGSWKTIAVDSE